MTVARLACVAGAALTLASVGARAQEAASADNYILLSDADGGRSYIGLRLVGRQVPEEPIEAFQARALDGAAVADLFGRLCLAQVFDRAGYDAALAGPAADFRPLTRSLPDFAAPKPLIGVNRVAATGFVQDHAAYGIASLWLGEGGDGITNRQALRYTGGLVITSPTKAKDFYAPQCNLTVRIAGLGPAAALLDGVQGRAAGATAIRRVDKPKFAFGQWTMPSQGGRVARITVEASRLNKPEQTVHLTIQLLPTGKTK